MYFCSIGSTTITTQNPLLANVSRSSFTLNAWSPSNFTYIAASSKTVKLLFTFQANNQNDWVLDDVSVRTSANTELLTNGNFENTPALTGWTTGATSGCVGSYGASSSGCRSGSCFKDQCPTQETWISQSFNVTAGFTYSISFWVFLVAGGIGSGPVTMNVNIS